MRDHAFLYFPPTQLTQKVYFVILTTRTSIIKYLLFVDIWPKFQFLKLFYRNIEFWLTFQFVTEIPIQFLAKISIFNKNVDFPTT